MAEMQGPLQQIVLKWDVYRGPDGWGPSYIEQIEIKMTPFVDLTIDEARAWFVENAPDDACRAFLKEAPEHWPCKQHPDKWVFGWEY